METVYGEVVKQKVDLKAQINMIFYYYQKYLIIKNYLYMMQDL